MKVSKVLVEAVEKLSTRYIKPGLVLCMDLMISVSASAAVLFVTRILLDLSFLTMSMVKQWLMLSLLSSFLSFYLTRSHKLIIRYFSLKDILKISFSVFVKAVLMAFGLMAQHDFQGNFLFVLLIDACFTTVLLVFVRMFMIISYNSLMKNVKSMKNTEGTKRILVFGTGIKSVSAVSRLLFSSHYKVVGFLVYVDEDIHSRTLSDLPIYYYKDSESFEFFLRDHNIDAVLFATDADVRAQSDLIKALSAAKVSALVAPVIGEVEHGVVKKNIREVKIEDLLGRPEIEISMDSIRETLCGKNVMVTGAAGSIGSELVRQIATMGVKSLVLFDNAETPMHYLRLELDDRFPDLRYVPIIGDVRLEARLDFAFRKYHPDIVFHAAAYKHVPLMEENPCEAVLVNMIGSRNVAEMCIRYGASKMVMISTDKAVNPTNVMGCSKRLAEIYVQSLGLAVEHGEKTGSTRFVTTRFGNVLGSNGSVIPRFREQIAKGGPVTVTHPEINRFFMTIPEACRLVLEAEALSRGNEIFVFDMGEPVKIDTLARRMIELAGLVPDKDIKIEYTGLRPGEKLYEEVLANAENTKPTPHSRIRVAQVREYSYADAVKLAEELETLSRQVDIPAVVSIMKEAVPEFHSTNEKLGI